MTNVIFRIFLILFFSLQRSRFDLSFLFSFFFDAMAVAAAAVASERIISSFNLLLLLQRVNDSCLLEALR